MFENLLNKLSRIASRGGSSTYHGTRRKGWKHTQWFLQLEWENANIRCKQLDNWKNKAQGKTITHTHSWKMQMWTRIHCVELRELVGVCDSFLHMCFLSGRITENAREQDDMDRPLYREKTENPVFSISFPFSTTFPVFWQVFFLMVFKPNNLYIGLN